MISIESQSVSVSEFGDASVGVQVQCSSLAEAAAWLAAMKAYSIDPLDQLDDGPCANCVENRERFDAAKNRFEAVAEKIRLDNDQAKRTIINLRQELAEAKGGEWFRGHSERLAQQLRESQERASALEAELERTKAALVKAQGKDMPQAASGERFSKLEVD